MPNKVDRTCEYCNQDHGRLMEIRFYDWNAVNNILPGENKYPIKSGGLLNTRLFCGQESCLRKAMKIRKEELNVAKR